MAQNRINNSASELTVDNLFLDGNTISSLDTNGDIVLAPDGSGVISVTSAPIVPSGDRAENLGSTTNSWDNLYCDGISFDDGTNVLDTVERGIWTPTISGSTTAGTATYSLQDGLYIRMGRLVIAKFQLVWTAHTGTGNMIITGLPFTSSSTSNINFTGSLTWVNPITLPANAAWSQNILNSSSSTILLQFSTTSGTAVNTAMDTNSGCRGEISYTVD